MDIEKFIKGFNKQIKKNGFDYYPFANECCYFFASMLKGSFPESEIMYDVAGHFAIKYKNKLYDMRGEYIPKCKVVSLKEIKEDYLWYGRVLEGNVYKEI